MSEELQPCRCGEIEHIYFITLHHLSRGGVVGLVQCHLCGHSVSFIAYPIDQGEFQAAGTVAWNTGNELDQLRQRVGELEAVSNNLRAERGREWERAEQAEAKLRELGYE